MRRSQAWMPCRSRPLRVALAAALTLLAFWMLSAPAGAAPLPGSTFQADDGDQATSPLVSDWQSFFTAGRVIIQDDPNANDSVINGKELNPDNWVLGTELGGALPSKNNVLAAWYATELLPSGNFIYFAFRRQDAGGDSYLAFVVNQRTDTWVNGAGSTIPCRTTGDVLISYETGTGTAVLGLARWTSTASDPATGCSKTGFYTDIPLNGTNAQGAVNNLGPIANFMTPGGATFGAGEFGEGALNLSDTLGYSCDRYRQIQVHTRASSSIDAALSDTADPVTIDMGGCQPQISVTGPSQLHHGDTASFQYNVTNVANNPLSTISVSDDRCPSANMTGPVKTVGDQDDILAKGEVWTYACSYTYTGTHGAGEADPVVSTATVTGTFGTSTVSDSATRSFDVLHPAIAVDQELRRGATGAYVQGPIDAHVGDTAFYRFTVTNPGDVALTVAPSFPACNGGTTTGPTGDADADGLLDPGESWVYLCRHALTSADADPFASASTVTGTDALGRAVSATDATAVDLLNPAVDVTGGVRRGASGPYSDTMIDARVGDTLEYRFLVTNPGDTPLSVGVSDPRCDTGTLAAAGGDTDADGRLDTGETWAYTCTHLVTAGDADPVDNRLTATGTDSLGLARSASSTESADLLNPAVAVDEELRLGTSGAYAQGPIEVHRGDEIGYRFTVTNTGDAPVSVSVSDPRCDAGTLAGPAGDTDADALLDLSETWTYTCRHVVTASDPDPVPSPVTATATDSLGSTATASDTAAADILTPGIAVDKTLRRGPSGSYVQGPIDVHAGDTIYYRFAVTNTSDSALSVTLADARCAAGTLSPPSGDSDADDRLDVDETWVYTCRHTVASSDPDPFVNQVTVTGRDNLGGESTAIDAATADVLHADAVVDSQVRVGGVGPYGDTAPDAHVGDTISYLFTVTNPGDTEVTVTVSVPRCDAGTLSGPLGDTDADGRLDPGEVWTYTCTHVLTTSDPDPFVVRAGVTVVDPIGGTVITSDAVSVDVLRPAIAVDEQLRRSTSDPYVDGPVDVHVGETLHYLFTVVNAGDTPLDAALAAPSCDTGTPSFTGGDTDADGLLDLTESWTYTCTRVVRATDADPLLTTATASGTDALGGTASGSDTAGADILHPSLQADKQARLGASGPYSDAPVDAHVGDQVSFLITVANTGDTPLTVALSDPRCDAGTLTGPLGDSNSDGWLDTAETWSYTCRHLIAATDADPFVNRASVTGTDALGASGTATSNDTASADLLHPGIAIDKQVRRGPAMPYGDGPVDAHVGDQLEYRMLVTNTGDAPLTVSVSDPRCDAGTLSGPSGDTDGDGRMGLTETFVYTCTHVIAAGDPDPFENTATATGVDALGGPVGTDTAGDVAGADLLHAGIGLDKEIRRGGSGAYVQGPVDALVGDTLGYRFTITNTGDAPLDVALADAGCDAGTLGAPSGDADGDGLMDTGETWKATCSHVVTSADPDPLVDAATVTGTDLLGASDSATDSASADLLQAGVGVDTQVRRGGTGSFVDGPVDIHVADTLEYRIAVTNGGDTPVTVALTGSRCDAGTISAPAGDTDSDGWLDATETWIYTCRHVVTGGDPDPVGNNVTATVTDSLGGTGQGSDVARADVLHAGIALDTLVRRGSSGAFAQGPVDARLGDDLEYRFVITNPGDAPLTVDFDDPACDTGTLSAFGGDSDGDGLLDVGETWTATCTHTLVAADDDPFVTSAQVTGTDAIDGTAIDTDGASADVLAAGIALDASAPADAHVGDRITFDFTVTNPGETALDVTIDGSRCDAGTLSAPSGDADGDDLLDLGETWTYQCTHDVAAADGDPFTNDVTATGTDFLGATTSDTAAPSVDVLHPAIAVDHEIRRGASGAFAQGPVDAHVGDTLTHRFTVTNGGDTPLAVDIDAARCDAGTLSAPSGDADGDGRLDLSESWAYTCTDAVQPADPDPLTSSVTATGTDVLDGTDAAGDDAGADVLHPQIALDAELRRGAAGPFSQQPVDVRIGDDVTYRFTVTNPGDTPLAVSLDEPRCDAGTLSAATGDSDGDARLDTGETWTFTCTHTVTAADADPLLTSTTATGTDVLDGEATSADGTHADVRAPAIAVTSRQRRGATGTYTAADVEAHVGDVLDYEFTVANTGDTPVVPDPSNPGCDTATLAPAGGDTDGDGSIDLDETWRYTCRHTVVAADPDPVVDTMSVGATDALDASTSDEDSVQADILKPGLEIVEEVSADGSAWSRSIVEVDVGQTLHYRFTVTNPGDAPLDLVMASDHCDAGTLARSGGDANGDGRLDPDETWSYSCKHVARPDDPAELETPVSVTGRDRIQGLAQASDTGMARLRPVADLELRKDAPGSVVAGSDIAFTLVAVNRGPSRATGVVVHDELPAGLTLKSADPGQGQCTTVGATVECALGSIASGASTSITVIAGTAGDAGGTSVTNTAAIAGTETDPDTSNNRDAATVAISRPAEPASAVDLVIDKSLLTSADEVGQRLTYLVTVVNDSAATAHDVTIHDTLTDAVRLVSATASQGTCSGAPAIRCAVGAIAAGQAVTVRIVVVALRAGTLTNRATVSAAETDPNNANNVSGVARKIRPRQTRQTLTKSADRRSARPGDLVTFTLTYRNRGGAAAHHVRVCDRLPAELSFVSAPGGRYRKGAVCWTRATVGRGQTLRFTVTTRVASTSATRSVNVATARAGNAAPATARAALRVRPLALRGGGVTG